MRFHRPRLLWRLAGGILALAAAFGPPPARGAWQQVLNPEDYAHYVRNFNAMEPEFYPKSIPNAQAWDWMVRNVPFFDCPAKHFEEIYYYRWWTFRKHIFERPSGYDFSEFIIWNGNGSATGHIIAEGRWLHDPVYLDQTIEYWYRPRPAPLTNTAPTTQTDPLARAFSQWVPDAAWNRYLVNMDRDFILARLDAMLAEYQRWEKGRMRPDGLYWQYDVRDAMEESISGSRTKKNVRPPLNSYQVANARAIARIADLAGRADVAAEYRAKGETLLQKMNAALWDPQARFYKVMYEEGGLCDAREAIGFIPFTLGLAPPEYADAYLQVRDPEGFRAPKGLTTAERRHPKFRGSGKVATCEWDGAVWPYATSQTLGGLADVLNGPPQRHVSEWEYFEQILTYAAAHNRDGLPYLGEYHDEVTGEWLKGRFSQRSRYYNHSTFCDLVISQLVGLRPRADDTVEVHPLVPEDTWHWFCLDHVLYHGRMLTIAWDDTGERYGRGAGLSVWADGQRIAHSDTLTRVTGVLPPAPKP